MATGKLLTGDFSMSKGLRGYFSCCFRNGASKSRQSSEEEGAQHGIDEPYNSDITQEKAANGSLRSSTKSNKSSKSKKGAKTNSKNGEKTDKKTGKVSAYNYDTADTSSDSDDEVLRRYQQSIQRVPSNRSIKSAALSHKSTTSKRSSKSAAPGVPTSSTVIVPQDDDEALVSMAEKGGVLGAAAASPPYSSDEEDEEEGKGGRRGGSRAASGSHHGSDRQSSSQQPESWTGSSSQISDSDYSDEGGHGDYANDAYTEEREEEGAERPSSKSSTEHALSANGDTASMSVGEHDEEEKSQSSEHTEQNGKPEEHLFDVSDLDREPVLISKCGNLDVTFEYDPTRGKMKVSIHNASEIPSKERGGASNTQVRLLLLPTKKVRHKTKIKQGECPVFDESFMFKVTPEDVQQMGVRFRLYGCERMRRERMIGESVIGFAMVNLDTPTTHTLALEPRSNLSHGDSKLDVSSLLSRSDSASSTQSMQHGGMPELLIGLAYNGTTGRLSVEVIKGSNFRNMAMNRAPDTYVKLTLMSPNGQEITRSKTSIRRGQPHPLFKETFMFQVALFQLADVTLMTSVYNKRSMKRKEMIGWFSLGYNNSGEEELAHWNDMRESKGEQVCRWHVLLEA